MSKKGENIYKRKDGRWEARYPKGYTDNGSIRYGYCYGKTYREVKEKVIKLKGELAVGIISHKVQEKKRFFEYCDEWLQLNRNKVKESTYVRYTNNIEKHIKPHLGGYYACALNSLIIEEFSHEMLCTEGLSSKTVRDILSLVKSILKYTSLQNIDMPLVNIVYPKDVKTDMRVLTKEEQYRFVNYLLSDMDNCKFGVLLALMTGLRIGELCALRWENISIVDKTVTVSSTMQRLKNLDNIDENKTKIIISDPKSNTSARIIPLPQYAAELCQEKYVHNPAAFVLTGKTDIYTEPRTLQYRFSKYVKDCNLEGVHFHVLRHTFATRCIEVGFEIKSLSEVLGHASPKITLERYVHSSLELKRENMNKLATIGF